MSIAGQMLDGRLDEHEGHSLGTALFAHCFTCTKSSKAAAAIARTLAKEGWRVLRFDFTGLGESEGDFAQSGFVSNVDDVAAAERVSSRSLMRPRRVRVRAPA